MEENHLHLKLSIRCFTVIGYWPIKFNNKLLNFLYGSQFKLAMVVYVLAVVSELIEFYMVIVKRDLEEFSFLLGVFCFHFLGLQKLAVFNGQLMKRLRMKVYATERNILRGEDDVVKKIYMEYVGMNHIANRIMIYTAMFCYLLFNCIPFISDSLYRPNPLYEIINGSTVYKPRALPLMTWFPFDRYKHYAISYVSHTAILTFYTPCVIGLNIFFYGLIIFAMGQIKILQENLMDIGKEGDEIENGRVRFEKLKKCIFHHRSIIQYITELSNAMKTFLLFDFIGYGLQFAVIGFQAAVMEFSLNFIVTIWYLATMLTQLFLIYWFANEVLLESLNISKAIWDSMWYICDENTKRIFSIIMMRAQKPLVLSVGPFYYMSTETLMSIIRVGYSYAMLMRRLYSK